MNIMYSDRTYLPIPYFGKVDLTLVQRIILAEKMHRVPTSLWFIDPKTLQKHQNINIQLPAKRSHLWSFYLPTRDCPLNYRELSMWFLLVSLAIGTRRKPGKGNPFADWFAGMETILGLGSREALPLCLRLVERELIDMEQGTGRQKTWFKIAPYEPFAHWFEENKAESTMPERFRVALENKNATVEKKSDPWNPRGLTKEQAYAESEARQKKRTEQDDKYSQPRPQGNQHEQQNELSNGQPTDEEEQKPIWEFLLEERERREQVDGP